VPDIAQETGRRRILNTLEAAQSAALTARNSTKIPTGYQHFELILTTLAGCRHSIERVLDQEQTIEILYEVSYTLSLWQSGPTETVVRSVRLAINERCGVPAPGYSHDDGRSSRQR
jgi:hypothetical protein